jgi:hypothetical protein
MREVMHGVSAAVDSFHRELALSTQLRRKVVARTRDDCGQAWSDSRHQPMAMSTDQAITHAAQPFARFFRENRGIFQRNCSDFLGHSRTGASHSQGNCMRPLQNPARAIALSMEIGCIAPSNLLKDGAVFILGDFVEPFPDEVPIHSAGRLSRNLMPYTLPQL